MSSEPLLSADEPGAIAVSNVSKRFTVYNRPIDRVREMGSLGFKRYGRDFWAVRNVSFAVRRGETVGLLGINGAGKSTILQMICGTLAPTEGRIETNGRISALLELGAGFSPEFTGRENVFLNGRILGMTEAEVEGCLGHIADFAGIGEFIDRPVRTYSSGMFVRLAFAVATNLNPDILIIDEALAVGDTAFQQRCYSHLRTRLGHATKLFVTHDLATLATMTERVIVLDGGRLAFDGATAEALRFYTDLTRQGTRVTLSRDGAPTPAPGLLPYEHDKNADSFFHIKEAALQPITERSKIGRREIDITDAAFLVDGYSSLAVAPGDRVTILVKVSSSLPKPTCGAIGFAVSDRRGQMASRYSG
jgi:ABC-type polysaccharide/polyol phosphate transport system ATPase subunit